MSPLEKTSKREIDFFGMKVVVCEGMPDHAMAIVSPGQPPVITFEQTPSVAEVSQAYAAASIFMARAIAEGK